MQLGKVTRNREIVITQLCFLGKQGHKALMSNELNFLSGEQRHAFKESIVSSGEGVAVLHDCLAFGVKC